MAENGGGQELDKLLISVDAELGDLKGIDSAINAMQSLSNFAQNAQKGAGALKVMADALNGIDKFGKTTSGIKKAKSGIDDLVGVLETLSKYTGSAKNSIRELGQLGKALHNFANIGTELKGLDKVVVGINGIIDAMQRLSGLSGSVKETTDAMANLGKSFDFTRDAKSAKRSRQELLRQLKGMRAVAPKVDTDAFDLSDSVEKGTKATIDAIEKSGEQIAKAKSNIYKNLLNIKNNKDNADFVSFDTMFAPKIIGSNIKNNLKAIKEARKNSGLNAISELGGQLTLGFDKNMDAFVADTKQAVTDFAKMYEYAEKIAKLATYKGGAISGLADRTEQMFFGSSKTGLTSNIATSKEKLHLEKGMMDNLWKEVKKQVDTMLHSHPFDFAAFSPNDIRTGIESSLLKGIDKQLVVGFKEISSFDFSRIQNKSNLDKIVEQFEKNLDKGIHDYYNNTIKFYEEAVAKANGMGKFNTSQTDATGIFRQAVEENIHTSLQELFGKTAFKISGMEEQIISDYFKGLNKNNAMFGAAEVGGIADAFANGITEKYKQCNFDFGKIRDTIHDNLGTLLTRLIHEQFGDEKASNTYQTMIKDSLKDALTSFGEKADDIYKSFNINDYIEHIKKGIFPEDAGKDSANKSIRVFETEADVIEKANRKLENLINEREKVLNRFRQTKEDLDRLDAKAGSRDYDYATQNAVQRYSAEYSKAKQALEKIEKQISDVDATKNSAKWLQSKEFGKDNAEKLSAEFDIEERVIKKYNDRLASLVEKREQIQEQLPKNFGNRDANTESLYVSLESYSGDIEKYKEALKKINAEGKEVKEQLAYAKEMRDFLLDFIPSVNNFSGEKLNIKDVQPDSNTETLFSQLNSYERDIEKCSAKLKEIAGEKKNIKQSMKEAKEMKDFLEGFIPTVNKFDGLDAIEEKLPSGGYASMLNKAPKLKGATFNNLQKVADSFGGFTDSLRQLDTFREVIEKFADLPKKLEGLDKTIKSISGMFELLKKLSEYEGNADSAITQLSSFGKALQKFANLGESLQGLDTIYKGVNKMIDTLVRLAEINGDSRTAIKQLGSLGAVLHTFNGLDDNVKDLNEIALGLINLAKATAMFSGSQEGDFKYIENIANSLGVLGEKFDSKRQVNFSTIITEFSKLVSVLASGNTIDTQAIKDIGDSLAYIQGKINHDTMWGVERIFGGLSTTLEQLSSSTSDARHTIDLLVAGFNSATDGFYTVRQNIEAVTFDFEEALKPIKDSDLFDILERFKHLNDSYKNVGGLGQGLGVLINALDMLNGRNLQTGGLTQLLEYFAKLANGTLVDEASKQMEKLGALAQPIASLINALKYTDFTEKNNVLDTLASQLVHFYSVLPENGDKFSFLLYGLRDLINLAKDMSISIPQNNVITQLTTALQGFNNIKDGKSIAGLLEGIKSIGEWLSPALRADTEEVRSQVSVYERSIESLKEKIFSFKQEQNALLVERDDADDTTEIDKRLDKLEEGIKSYESMLKKQEEAKLQLERSINGTNIDTSPIVAIAQALEKFDSIGKNLENFRSVMNSLKALKNIRVDNLKGLELVLEGVFDALDTIPEGKVDSLKGLASVVRALNNAQSVDPEQLNLVADGLVKILNALNGISGSGNSISIKLDSSGVANFQKVVDKTNNEWDEFSDNLQESLGNIDVEGLFNFDAPLKELQKQLGQAERTYASLQRKILAEQQNVDKYANRLNNPQESSRYRDHVTSLEQAKKAAQDYEAVIRRLRESIDNYSGFDFNNDADALVAIRQMEKEYKNLQKFMEDYKKDAKSADPESTMGQGFEMVGRRMEYLKEQIDLAHEHLKEMPDTIEGIGIRTKDFVNQLRDATAEAKKLNSELGQNIGKGFGEFGSMLSSSGSKFLGSIGNLSSMYGKAISDGTAKLDASKLKNLQGLAGILGKVAKGVSQVGAIVNVVTSAFRAWWGIAEKVQNALTDLLKKVVDFSKALLTKVVGALKTVASAVQKVASLISSGANAIGNALKKVGEAGSKLVGIFGKVGGAVASAMKGVKAVLGLVSPRIVRILAQSNGSLKNIIKNTHLLKGAIKTVTRYFSMFTRMLMRKSITAFINEMKQAFEDLAVYEHDAGDEALRFNTNVSKIFSQLRVSANQWMGAFEPLINAVTPLVLNFLYQVQAMGENVAKFMAILTGQSYYIRAKTIYEDYAESLDKANKSQKNLTNGLDELNILNDKKDSSLIDPLAEFEKVDIDGALDFPNIQSILDKLKDWLDGIDWEKIKDKVREVIERIMDIVNQILDDVDLWGKLGKFVAELFNVLMTAWNEFIKNFDPVKTAKALAQFIIDALKNIDWELIHENIELTAKKFAQFWNEIFANDELWDEIAKAITNLLNEIVHYFDTFAWEFDFSQMAQQLTDTITKILKNFDWEQLRHAVEGWVKGLVDFINTVAANKDFWTELGNSISKCVNIIIEAFKNLGDIDFADLTDSLKTAIENALNINWKDFFAGVEKWATNIADVINGIFGDKDFLTKITTTISNFINGLIDGIDSVIQKLKDYDIGKAIGDALVSGLSTIDWDTLFRIPADAINALSNAIKGLLDSIPDDFNLGDWLAEHLNITMENIDWETIKQNVDDFGKKVADYINGLVNNDQFWKNAGLTLGNVLELGWNIVIKPLMNVDFEKLVDSIRSALSTALQNFDLPSKMGDLGNLTQKIINAIDSALKKTNWAYIGQQIGLGIASFIGKINANSIAQTVYDAIVALSNTIGALISTMVNNNTFYKLGVMLAEAVYGALAGLATFFTNNTGELKKALSQFVSGVLDFIKANKPMIVKYLNQIIDGLSKMLQGLSQEKHKLIEELADILEQSNLAQLLGTIIGMALNAFFGGAKIKAAITTAVLTNLKSFFLSIWDTIDVPSFISWLVRNLARALVIWLSTKVIKKFVSWVASKAGLALLGSVAGPVGTVLGLLIGYIIEAILDKLNVFDFIGDKIAGWLGKDKKSNSSDDLQNQLDEAMAQLDTDYEVEITPTFSYDTSKLEEMDWDSYMNQRKGGIIIDDPKFGTITASQIEVETLKPLNIDTEKISANILEVVEIFADVLHVKEIDSNTNANSKDMEKYFGENYSGAQGGTISKDKDLYVGDIFGDTLTVKEILAEVLKVAEIIAELLTVVEANVELMNIEEANVHLMKVDKDETKLLEAKKITTELLEVIDIVGKTLKVETIEGELKKDGLNLVSGSTNTVAGVGYSSTITTDKVMANVLNVGTINANTLNVGTIASSILNVGNIVANTLKVGDIQGSVNGLTTSLLDGISSYTTALTYPTFDYGDRWSDISGLVPSAEDYLDGIENLYNDANTALSGISSDVTNALQNASDSYVESVTMSAPKFYADNDSSASSGSLSKDKSSDRPAGTADIDLPDNAKYIKDYLMKIIGNENGVYGLMGNLYKESGLRSNNLQDSYNTKTLTDEAYTQQINNGGNFIDSKGYGLAQWTEKSRKQGYLNSLNGRSVDDLDAQLEYIAQELQSPEYAGVLNTLKNAKSIHEASSAVLKNYEQPAEQGFEEDALRWHYGEGIKKLLGNEKTEEEPKEVKKDEEIKNIDKLNDISDNTAEGGTLINPLYDNFLLGAEYLMAKLYDIIDKWLGRIYKLLDSFQLPPTWLEFLETLAQIMDADVNGDSLIKTIEKSTKAIEELTRNIQDLNLTLGKQLNSDKITKKLDEVIKAIKESLSNITCNCNCNCDCGGCCLKNGQQTTDVPMPYYYGENTYDEADDTPYVSDETSGGTTPTNPTTRQGGGSTPTNPTSTRPNGRSTGGGGVTPTGRTSYPPTSGTTNRGGGTTRRGGGTTKPSRGSSSGGGVSYRNADMLSLLDNGKEYKLYVTLDGERFSVGKDMPRGIRERLMNGEGTLDLDGVPLSAFKGKFSSSGFDVSKDSSWRSMMKKLWGGGYTGGDETGFVEPNDPTQDGGDVDINDILNGTSTSTGDASLDRNGGRGGNTTYNPETGSTTTDLPHLGGDTSSSQDTTSVPSKKNYADADVQPDSGWSQGEVSSTPETPANNQQEKKEENKGNYTTPDVSTGVITDQNGNTVGHMDGYWKDENGNGSYWLDGKEVSKEEYNKGNKNNVSKGLAEKREGSFYDDFVSDYAWSTPDVATGMTNYYDKDGNIIASIPTKDIVEKNKEKGAQTDERFKNNAVPDVSTGVITDKDGNVTGHMDGTWTDSNGKTSYWKDGKEYESKEAYEKELQDGEVGKAQKYWSMINSAYRLLSGDKGDLEQVYQDAYKAYAYMNQGSTDKRNALAKQVIDIAEKAGIDLNKSAYENAMKFKKQEEKASSTSTASTESASNTVEAKSGTVSEKATDTKSAIDAYIKLFNDNIDVMKNPVSDAAQKLFAQAGITAGAKVYFADGKKATSLTPWQKANNYATYAREKRLLESEMENNGEVTGFSFNNFTSSNPASDFENWYKNSFLVRGYQMGGVPNSGELFVARENGTPEYIGSFGGKTAVANNDQIVTAVANGVSMANDRMVSAIQEQTNALENAINNKDVNVTIGDRQIAEANRRGQQSMGGKFVE